MQQGKRVQHVYLVGAVIKGVKIQTQTLDIEKY